MEELLLDALLAGEELHVVDQKHVNVAVALAEFRQAVLLQGLNELVGELLGRKVGNAGVGVGAEDGVPDGVHQVGFAQAGVAIDEQRIVGLRGGLGHGEGRGVGHLVVGADDEGLERVTGVEGAGGGAALVVAGRAARGGAAARGGGLGGPRGVGGRRGPAGVGLAKRDIDQAAGSQAQALRDQVEVVVVDPDRRKVVGHPQRHGVLRGLEAHHRLEPHLKNVFRKELLKVAFDGFPEAGGQGQRGHGGWQMGGFIHTGAAGVLLHVWLSLGCDRGQQRNSCLVIG